MEVSVFRILDKKGERVMKKIVVALVLCCSFGVGNVMSYYTSSDCERAKQQCSYYQSQCLQGNLGKIGRPVGEGLMAVGGDLDEAINRPDYDLWNAHEQKRKQDCAEKERTCREKDYICSHVQTIIRQPL
jgi:hypothetical protein